MTVYAIYFLQCNQPAECGAKGSRQIRARQFDRHSAGKSESSLMLDISGGHTIYFKGRGEKKLRVYRNTAVWGITAACQKRIYGKTFKDAGKSA